MRIHIHDQKARRETLRELNERDQKNTAIPNGNPDPHRLLVVDDDPTFRKLVRGRAEQRNFTVIEAGSLAEVKSIATPNLFDVAIVDYFIDDAKSPAVGTEVAEELDYTPTVLVSGSDDCVQTFPAWGPSIRRFCSKDWGVEKILNEAISIQRPSKR